MSHPRLLGGIAAAALAIGGLAAAAMPASATQHASTTTTSTTVAGHGWVTNAQGPGSGSITGAVAPGGRDAARLAVQGDGTIMTLFGTSYVGTKFADITGLSYDTYIENSEQAILAPSIGVEVWGGDGSAFLGSMVYEPYVADAGQPVEPGVWQHWDASDPTALWWSSRAVLNPDGSVLYPAQQAHTLADFEAAFAAYPAKYGNLRTLDGVKTYVGSSSGASGWNNFVGYVDDVHVTTTASDTDWDFTTGLASCSAAVNAATKTYSLTDDCSTLSTINVPDRWTIDGTGHTLTAVEDAAHQNFPGPVLLSATGNDSGPAVMNVANLDLETSGFQNGQNSSGQLAGLKYVRAGGTISHVTINGISHGNGVQEGIALWVRNRDAAGSANVPEATLNVDHVTVTNYQKSGMVLDGNLAFDVSQATVGSAAGPLGAPLTTIAANAVQVSRGAHGSISDSTIALNDYNPSPPPGDGSDATALLLYNAQDVTLERTLVTGDNGDVGMDVYNDGTGSFDTVVTASCNLFSRDEQSGDYDPYGVGIATYDDGSTPVTVQLSDSTFAGWNYDTALISYDGGGNPIYGAGPVDQALGACAPSTPGDVTLSGGDQATDVSWTASTAPAYAPLTGYDVVATDGADQVVATQHVDADTTTAHLTGLPSGADYTVTVTASSTGGTSTAATATLHATTLTMIADKDRIIFGKHTTLEGLLQSTAGGSLAGRQVVIQHRAAGSADAWAPLATVTVSATGSFSRSVAPTTNNEYRAVYAGAPDNSSVSVSSRVDVAMFVKAQVSSKHAQKGDRLFFTGLVSPNHAGYPVRLQVQNIDGTWSTVNAEDLDSQSSFGLHYKVKHRGTVHFRIFADGDDTHVDGHSATMTVTVS